MARPRGWAQALARISAFSFIKRALTTDYPDEHGFFHRKQRATREEFEPPRHQGAKSVSIMPSGNLIVPSIRVDPLSVVPMDLSDQGASSNRHCHSVPAIAGEESIRIRSKPAAESSWMLRYAQPDKCRRHRFEDTS